VAVEIDHRHDSLWSGWKDSGTGERTSVASSLSDLSDRSEPSGRARTDGTDFEAHSGSINEKSASYGPLSRRRSRSVSSPTGS
jgi:hypothetical protein